MVNSQTAHLQSTSEVENLARLILQRKVKPIASKFADREKSKEELEKDIKKVWLRVSFHLSYS